MRRGGGDVTRLGVRHQDGSASDPASQEVLLSHGLWIEYDSFGSEGVFAFGDTSIPLPADTRRIAEVAAPIEAGHGSRLLIAKDICDQSGKRGWGGGGSRTSWTRCARASQAPASARRRSWG